MHFHHKFQLESLQTAALLLSEEGGEFDAHAQDLWMDVPVPIMLHIFDLFVIRDVLYMP